MRRALLALLAVTLPAETPPKASPAEYPVKAELPGLVIAADYTVRTVFGRDDSALTPDYLTVDVALYPPKGKTISVAASQFRLRVNGKKQPLYSQTPGMVAASLRYPDWEQRPTVLVGAGAGDAQVILGRPQPTERFPGDPRPQQGRLPPPPKAPTDQDRSGIERPPARSPADIVTEEALPEGDYTFPRHGHLYFPFKGKTASLKSVELLYEGPAGKAALVLR